MHEAEFPPNKYEIWARLTHPYVDPLDFDSLTCDEAAQVISGIDSNGFNQADADDFEHISLLINRSIIANTIPSIENNGAKLVNTIDVIGWALSKNFDVPMYVMNWYKNKVIPIFENAKISNQNSSKSLKELKKGIFDIWIVEGRPEAREFFPDGLKKHKRKTGSPITEVFTSGKEAGIEFHLSNGSTGRRDKKTIENWVTEFKKR